MSQAMTTIIMELKATKPKIVERCSLCKRVPTETVEFECTTCDVIFWRGPLCKGCMRLAPYLLLGMLEIKHGHESTL